MILIYPQQIHPETTTARLRISCFIIIIIIINNNNNNNNNDNDNDNDNNDNNDNDDNDNNNNNNKSIIISMIQPFFRILQAFLTATSSKERFHGTSLHFIFRVLRPFPPGKDHSCNAPRNHEKAPQKSGGFQWETCGIFEEFLYFDTFFGGFSSVTTIF